MALREPLFFDQERLNELQLFTRQTDPATDGFRTILTDPCILPIQPFCQMVA